MLANPALRTFWATPARNYVLYGGRGSSKSFEAATQAVFIASKIKTTFLCVRQFQNKTGDSIHSLVSDRIESMGLSSEFDIQATTIKHLETGSQFLFYGLYRNVKEIKSLNNIDICWIEEAQSLTGEQWSYLEPTLREEGSRFWITFNPHLKSDFVYQKFIVNPPASTIVRKINYDENPFLSDTMKDLIEDKRVSDYEDYEHVYLGIPLSNDEGSIIKEKWIRAAIDAHLTLGIEVSGKMRVGFDPADGTILRDMGNNDANSLCVTKGNVTLDLESWIAGEDEIVESTGRVYQKCLEVGADVLIYDCIGVGAGAGSIINGMNQANGTDIKHSKFNAGGKVIDPDAPVSEDDPDGNVNKDHFENAKSQIWFDIANRFRITYDAIVNYAEYYEDDIISISSDCSGLEGLIDQLSTPRKSYSKAGKLMVERKQDLAKRGIRSPNDADSFVMANSEMIVKENEVTIMGVFG